MVTVVIGKKHVFGFAAVIALALIVSSFADVGTYMPWHFLQQVAKGPYGAGDQYRSIDENSDGIVDAAQNLSCAIGMCYVDGNMDISGELAVNGDIKLANSGSSCDSVTAGSIRWNPPNFEGCNGTAWITVMGGGAACSDTCTGDVGCRTTGVLIGQTTGTGDCCFGTDSCYTCAAGYSWDTATSSCKEGCDDLAWAGTINHSDSVTAYGCSGGSCASQNRLCTDGVLGGSYTSQSCPSCYTPPTIACYSDSGCTLDDGKECTVNKCYNPGTTSSYCSNLQKTNGVPCAGTGTNSCYFGDCVPTVSLWNIATGSDCGSRCSSLGYGACIKISISTHDGYYTAFDASGNCIIQAGFCSTPMWDRHSTTTCYGALVSATNCLCLRS